MKYQVIISLFLFSCGPFTHADQTPVTLYVVIHGTWAAHQTWNRPGGLFYDELMHAAAHFKCATNYFNWSGKLDNKSRIAAGKELAHYIQQLPSNTSVCLVAHSHGANVGILASQELGKIGKGHKIERFYALAPPVNLTDYMPNMDVIHYFYNFFSLHDYVQPVLGIFGRIYPDHPRIANIRIILEGKYGTHSQLHDPMIGRWIPHIHEPLGTKKRGNFETFAFGKPGIISFFKTSEPYYQEDIARRRLLEEDFHTQQEILINLNQAAA